MPRKLLKRRRKAERRRIRTEIFCGIIATSAVAFLYAAGIFRSLDFSISDWLTRLRSPPAHAPEVAIIEIGQETLDTIGKWPIPRDIYTRLVSFLGRAGARAVGFNIMFTEESSPEEDRELADAISRAGMVYLPIYLKQEPDIPGFIAVVDNIPPIKAAAKAEGIINMPPDVDGVVRRFLPVIRFKGKNYFQLAFLIACDWMGVEDEDIDLAPGGKIRLETARGEEISIPLDGNRAVVIDWSGRWRRAFDRYAVADVLESEEKIRSGLPPRIPPDVFTGRICLVGLTAPGTFDAMRTPLEQVTPSIAIHATIVSQLIQGRFLSPLYRWENLLIIVVLGLVVSVIFPRLRPGAGIVAIFAVCLLYLLAAGYLYFTYRILMTILYPMGAMFISYLSITIRHEIAISFERSRLQHLATHDSLTDLFVIGHFRLLLEAEIKEVRKRGSALSLIMIDLDHFKRLNDTCGHLAGDFVLKETSKILLSACRDLDIVARYGGEEFVIMLPDTGMADALGVAERIRASVEEHAFARAGRSIKVTVSCGVSVLEEFDSAEDLIKKADAALYYAKRAGRNMVCNRGRLRD